MGRTMSSELSKKARREAERERFKALPEGDLIEMRATLSKEVRMLVAEKERKSALIQRITNILLERRSTEVDRVVVTDHAVVRYLERVDGLDLEGVRQTITEIARRAVRRDEEFMDDPVTGLIVVRRIGSDSVATVMDKGSAARRPKAGEDTII
jgi:hypothetical protein